MANRSRNDIEKEIEEIKRHWPIHSVPPALIMALEDLEAELEAYQDSDPEEGFDA